MVSVSAKKVKKKMSCLCTLKSTFWRSVLVGFSFAYVVHFVFFGRCLDSNPESCRVSSRCATNLSTHLPLATHLQYHLYSDILFASTQMTTDKSSRVGALVNPMQVLQSQPLSSTPISFPAEYYTRFNDDISLGLHLLIAPCLQL
jgi:hypothetical protein